MAKIGTAHVEIKPVISDEVLEAITERIADAVALGVERGMAAARQPVTITGGTYISADGYGVIAKTIQDRKGRGPSTP